MQFIVESDWSFAVFVGIALLMMMLATFYIFGKRRSVSDIPKGAMGPASKWRWKLNVGSLLPVIIAFAMMFVGMALVGAWYYIKIPVVSDYTFNIMAVTLIAAIIAAVAAYGIALIRLYAKSNYGRK